MSHNHKTSADTLAHFSIQKLQNQQIEKVQIMMKAKKVL